MVVTRQILETKIGSAVFMYNAMTNASQKSSWLPWGGNNNDNATQTKPKSTNGVSVLDQKRLDSFNAFHQRFTEYQNNIHIKLSNSSDTKFGVTPGIGEIVANTLVCNVDEKHADGPQSVTLQQFSDFMNDFDFKHKSPSTFAWIHINNLICLDELATKFHIHELCAEGFEDLRAHSMFLPSSSGALVSFCVHAMVDNCISVFKIFIYMANGLVVTHLTEILPDISNPTPLPTDKIIISAMRKCRSLLQRGKAMSPIHVVYHLAMETLRLQDGCLEFFSTGVSYFQQVVYLPLLHREKMEMMIKMHTISNAASVMQHSIQETEAMFSNLVDVALAAAARATEAANSAGGQGGKEHPARQSSGSPFGGISTPKPPGSRKSFLSQNNSSAVLPALFHESLISDEHIPYLIDLYDAYAFVHACLNKTHAAMRRLDEELDATVQLRSANTNIVLSFIATTFLPMTFLAGIFGMNFERNGNFSIWLLNVSYGPDVFGVMCLVSFLMTFGYFMVQGWIEVPLLTDLKDWIYQKHIDDSSLDAVGDAAQRAADIDQKRKARKSRYHSITNASNEGKQGPSLFTSSFNPLASTYFQNGIFGDAPPAATSAKSQLKVRKSASNLAAANSNNSSSGGGNLNMVPMKRKVVSGKLAVESPATIDLESQLDSAKEGIMVEEKENYEVLTVDEEDLL